MSGTTYRPDEAYRFWHDLATGADVAGPVAQLAGYLWRSEFGGPSLLLAEPPCCAGCPPRNPATSIEITGPARFAPGPVTLAGTLHPTPAGWQLRDARPVIAGFGRRRLLAAAPLLCLAAAAPDADPRTIIADSATVDMHSHAGKLLFVRSNAAFGPLAEPMRQGGMAITCLAIVSDAPTHRVGPDHRIHPFRDPAPGEMSAYGERCFARLHALVQQQSLAIITDAAGLHAARAGRPSVVVSAEGADFLEGDPTRIDAAYDRWKLRHLQLVHYRVNELGDIQTEPTVHGGLTDAGAAVIQHCNARGIVVDVAHGTLDLVRRAAAVTTKPLVLSHTSLTTRPRPFTRLITPEHARLVAGTGGVIGIWPPAGLFPDMAALAGGIARMVAVVGVDHVGLGTDMMGLVGASTFDSYAQLPDLVAALTAAGFGADDVRKILGGNYHRVFAASLA
jgi:membrane dipeptidase